MTAYSSELLASISFDKIVVHAMGRKASVHRLFEAIHCSIIALCQIESNSSLVPAGQQQVIYFTKQQLCQPIMPEI
ncbi:unnamed protein product [Larinioides sclopetarius]|uniref:Uncharacterized protein n=1 Tax=Larinioides sclopetarius TaxID=280406 RepID=A0AAV2AV43_9ARAC